MGDARVEVLGHQRDGARLARRVPPLEHDRHPGAGRLHPGLELDQFDLVDGGDGLVGGLWHPGVVGVAGGDQIPLAGAGDGGAHGLGGALGGSVPGDGVGGRARSLWRSAARGRG